MTNTILSNIEEQRDRIRHELNDLKKHSEIYRSAFDDDIFTFASGDYSWQELSTEGIQVQTRLKTNYQSFTELINTLLQGQSSEMLHMYGESLWHIEQAIFQEGGTIEKDVEIVFNEALRHVREVWEILSKVYSEKESPLYVPDTNALIHNPKLDEWKFSETNQFTMILTPTVLSELDALKMNHKNERVRKKAESIIKQIKEYRRRGSILDGVVLRSNRSQIRSIAIEPNMKTSLSWLDKDNNDDRILAMMIEIMRTHPQSPVILVTRDINIQNKAEFSRIPFVEPPETS